MAVQVSSLEPGFVSFGEWGEFPMKTGLHYLVNEVMGSKGFISSGREGLKAVFHSRKVGVRNDSGKSMGFEAHHKKEQQFSSDRVRVMIVCEFCMGDDFRPRGGVCTTEDMEICFNLLVNVFSFSIGSRVVGCGEGKIISKGYSSSLVNVEVNWRL